MVKSGVLSTTLAEIYVCDNKDGVTVEKMRFTNDVAYNLNILLFSAADNKTTTLYSLILDAGDTVTDNMGYDLQFGDKISASSTAGKTFYSLKIV